MQLKNATRKKLLASQANVCDTIMSRAKGLMFHTRIKDTAFILSFSEEQKVALHMFFVFFPIDVLFLDRERNVVEIKKHFMPFTQYMAEKSSKYVIELPAGTIDATRTIPGDRIEFCEVIGQASKKR
jgi:uncharacterized protein